MWQIAHTPNHLCWSCVKFDDVTIRITDRKNVLYRLLDFKYINQNCSKHAEWITLRMFFVVIEVTFNIRLQSSITTSQRGLFILGPSIKYVTLEGEGVRVGVT